MYLNISPCKTSIFAKHPLYTSYLRAYNMYRLFFRDTYPYYLLCISFSVFISNLPVLAAAPDIILHSTSNFSTCPLPCIIYSYFQKTTSTSFISTYLHYRGIYITHVPLIIFTFVL